MWAWRGGRGGVVRLILQGYLNNIESRNGYPRLKVNIEDLKGLGVQAERIHLQ